MKPKPAVTLPAAALGWMFLSSTAVATVKLDGFFIANHACEVFQSKKNKTNPGDVLLVPRVAYDMIGMVTETQLSIHCFVGSTTWQGLLRCSRIIATDRPGKTMGEIAKASALT